MGAWLRRCRRSRPELADWLHAQPMFFVATAPSGDDGHVNVSPKGYDTFRVLGAERVSRTWT